MKKVLNLNKYIHIYKGTESDFYNICLSYLHKKRSIVRYLRGQKCTRKNNFFDEFAAALQFPYYFGQNWDAFDECINDLSWTSLDLSKKECLEPHSLTESKNMNLSIRPEETIILFISNYDQCLLESVDDKRIFMNSLKNYVLEWYCKDVGFHIVLHNYNDNSNTFDLDVDII